MESRKEEIMPGDSWLEKHEAESQRIREVQEEQMEMERKRITLMERDVIVREKAYETQVESNRLHREQNNILLQDAKRQADALERIATILKQSS
jgi:hypothetical protein